MGRRSFSTALWIAAFLVAVLLGYFQRTTGPTYPKRGTIELAGAEVRYKLLRTHGGEGGLQVRIPVVGSEVSGTVEWRRYPTDDAWAALAMRRDQGGALAATIPHQPPAGKVEYRVLVRDGERAVRIPAEGDVIARFRGDVPAGVLIPHILAMFGSMMLATRALFEVLRPSRPKAARLVLASMVLLVLGGLFLGPVVQKFAFDAYWTGWPLGTDLTDNKTAVAVLAWLPATILAARGLGTRWAVVVGWLVMMGVFLVPHSLRGSEIDWSEHRADSTAVGQTSLVE
jgi:hypothetical protein